MTDLRQQLTDLLAVPPGSYKVRAPWWDLTARRGWLAVEKDNDGVSIMWTTSKETHNALSTAFSVDITPEGILRCYMESAWTMHIVWGYGYGDEEDYQTAVDGVQWMHEKLKDQIP